MTQEEWDRLLVESFYLRPDYCMWRLFWELGEDSGLRRVPHRFHSKMKVCAFVCGHLPKLANVLWKTDIKSVDRVVGVLSKSRIDTLKVGMSHNYNHRQVTAMKREKKEHAAVSLAYVNFREWLSKNSRSPVKIKALHN